MAYRERDVIEMLNDLIATCRDSEQGFLKAAKGIHSDAWRDILTGVANVRDRFAQELEAEVRRWGAQPETTGHIGEILHRGWVDLEARIRPRIDETILEDCTRGEEATEKHYRRALAQDLPPDVRAMVEEQFRNVRQTLEQLRGERAGGAW